MQAHHYPWLIAPATQRIMFPGNLALALVALSVVAVTSATRDRSATATASDGPLACQPNDEQPMLPTFHVIGNVTMNADKSIKLEPINDCSGVT